MCWFWYSCNNFWGKITYISNNYSSLYWTFGYGLVPPQSINAGIMFIYRLPSEICIAISRNKGDSRGELHRSAGRCWGNQERLFTKKKQIPRARKWKDIYFYKQKLSRSRIGIRTEVAGLGRKVCLLSIQLSSSYWFFKYIYSLSIIIYCCVLVLLIMIGNGNWFLPVQLLKIFHIKHNLTHIMFIVL